MVPSAPPKRSLVLIINLLGVKKPNYEDFLIQHKKRVMNRYDRVHFLKNVEEAPNLDRFMCSFEEKVTFNAALSVQEPRSDAFPADQERRVRRRFARCLNRLNQDTQQGSSVLIAKVLDSSMVTDEQVSHIATALTSTADRSIVVFNLMRQDHLAALAYDRLLKNGATLSFDAWCEAVAARPNLHYATLVSRWTGILKPTHTIISYYDGSQGLLASINNCCLNLCESLGTNTKGFRLPLVDKALLPVARRFLHQYNEFLFDRNKFLDSGTAENVTLLPSKLYEYLRRRRGEGQSDRISARLHRLFEKHLLENESFCETHALDCAITNGNIDQFISHDPDDPLTSAESAAVLADFVKYFGPKLKKMHVRARKEPLDSDQDTPEAPQEPREEEL